MVICKNLTLVVWIYLGLMACIKTAAAAPAPWTLDAAYDCNPSVVRAIKDGTAFSWYSPRGLVSWRETRVATQNGDTVCAEEILPNARIYSESEYKSLRASITDAQKKTEKSVSAEEISIPLSQLKTDIPIAARPTPDNSGSQAIPLKAGNSKTIESSPVFQRAQDSSLTKQSNPIFKILPQMSVDNTTVLWQYDDRVLASYSGFPGQTIAYIRITFSTTPSGTYFRCTGTLITPNLMLTAGHCIFSAGATGDNETPTSLDVYPALYTSNGTAYAPLGKRSAVNYFYTSYFKKNYDSTTGTVTNDQAVTDIAAVVLDNPFNLTTFLPVAYSDAGTGAQSQGYPAYVNNQFVQDQYYSSTSKTLYTSGAFSQYPLFTSPGNSGGPLFVQRSDSSLWLVGNVSSGQITGLPIVTQGPHYENLFAGTVIQAATTDATTRLASAITPQTGWWWNPNDVAGRGYSIEVSNGRIFLAAYMFRDDSTPVWYIADEVYNSPGFSGKLFDVQGTQTLNSTGKGTTSAGTTSVQISGTFTSETQGTLTLTGGPLGTSSKTIPITRFPIDSASVKAPSSTAAPQTGWWSNTAEPGVGYFIEQQGSQIFFANYLYGADQRDVWYISLNGALPNGTSGEVMTGSLLQVTGGQTLTSGPLTAASSTIGQVTLQFTSPTSGTITLPNGRVVPITRFTAF